MVRKLFGTLAAITLLTLVSQNVFSADDEICQLVSRTCAEGPETRTIDQVDVYRECWRYDEEYFCQSQEQINTCAGLQTACVVTDDTCLTYDTSGYCIMNQYVYSCGETQSNTDATLIDSTYTIVKDEIDSTTCDNLANNQSCENTGSVCTEGPETRIINGLEVTKSCWAWENQYTCYAATYDNYCEPLETLCEQTSTECLHTLANGACAVESQVYDCDTTQPDKEGIVLIDEQYSITGEDWEGTCDNVDPECVETEAVCTEGAETRNINGMLIYRDCWHYDRTYVCLSGEASMMCDDIDEQACQASSETCLAYSDNGQCVSTSIEYTCTYQYDDSTVLDCGNQIFCMGEDCYDTGYEPSPDFGLAVAYLNAATQSGEDITEDSVDIFSAHVSECSKFALSTVNCCDDSGWANGSMTGCSNADLTAIEERAAGLTHYVGTYCSSRLEPFNTCIEYKQAYCTFNSMIARIVQEGARPQLGRSWGSASSPNCEALSPDDMEYIDFTLIDFSEYINSMSVTDLSNDELAQRVQDSISN